MSSKSAVGTSIGPLTFFHLGRDTVRVLGYLMLALATAIFVVAFVTHFTVHSDQLANPITILERAGAVLDVYSHPARHPSTMLGTAALVVAVTGIVLTWVGQRSRKGR